MLVIARSRSDEAIPATIASESINDRDCFGLGLAMTGVSRFRSITAIAMFLLFFSSFFLPTPASAQQCINNTPQEPCKSAQRSFITNADCACCGNCQLSDFVGLAVEVSRYIFGISGSLALLMIIYGAFRWLTAAGNAEAVSAGTSAMTAAIIGLLIVFGAWVIVNFVLAALTGQVDEHGAAQILGGTWWKVR